jgi:hypothetical protein
MRNLAVISALLGSSAALYNATETVTYASTLKCGKCIRGGYVFCFQGTEGQMFNGTDPTTNCCQTESGCTQISTSGWVCSNGFSDPDYALSMCPFKNSTCGQNQNNTFSTKGASTLLNVTGLKAGESCVYKIKS